MTAIATRFTGFSNFTRKDAHEWVRTRRAVVTAITAQVLVLLGVLAIRIYGTLQPSAEGLDWSPSVNMENAGWLVVVPLFAVFLTMGMLVSEREARTLPWSLSMPLTRTSVLFSKLATSIVGVGLLVVVLPMITAIAAVRIVYGDFPSNASVLYPVLSGASVGLLVIVVNLAANVFFKSQRSAAGASLCAILVVPGLIEAFYAKASPWWPSAMGDWIVLWGKAEPRNWITPVVFVATIGVLVIAALLRFSRDEM
jgi:hypothetical protein